ncbi:MAG: bifunctional diguanylate cyclase/phosphodiesterase [Pyrinomonadaceae bacterium]|nr:bifunctional diguanylate cyclase/phosphodiesterase [Pyrinomonadaceae bacterium]
MNQERFFTFYKFAIIAIGCLCLGYAIASLPDDAISVGFAIYLVLSFSFAPFMNIKLPRGNLALGFSDSLIFLCFLLYGGKAAIIVAAVEMLANCISLKRNGMQFRKWLVHFNVALNSISTLITFGGLLLFLEFSQLDLNSADTSNLLPVLGVLAILQFLSSSAIHSPASPNFRKKPLWKIWQEDFFSGSLAHIAGAGIAFVAYKILNYGSSLTISIALILIGIAYINYRRTIADINESIEQAEKAERDKTEIEKQKADEAKRHASELEGLLEKEEEISQDLRLSKEELEYSAYHDSLTDLPNRAYLMERLKFLVEMGSTLSEDYYIVFLDLSRFKNINDIMGHSVGDDVLKIVALRLRRALRDEDTISRLGGDEFAIILTNLSSMEKAQKVVNKIYDTLTKPFMVQGNKIFSDLHIGIAPLDFEHIKPEDVLRDADIAMQHAKDKNLGLAIFNKEIRASHLERIRLEADLRHAVERSEFEMHYQPLISLKDGNVLGFEALLRWNHSELGLISPAQFIPISEETGSIIPITNWILRETCLQLVEWNETLPDEKDFCVSVNISGRHLAEDKLVRDVKRALRLSGLTPKLLKLEITESTAMDNAEKTIEVLHELKSLGVQISIDDFGTGYSSLSYLHRLPFDTLKIDRSFVMNADQEGSEDIKILETIISLTKNLDKKVIAEGIETEEQLSILMDLDCDYGQGYLFSKPVSKQEVAELIRDIRPWLSRIDPSDFRTPVSEIELDRTLQPF